ncbi:MAG: cell division protein SepF [Lachnospiraceae bacterium]|nr:cell division protein SepF [Lachnospiraceae bacterium]
MAKGIDKMLSWFKLAPDDEDYDDEEYFEDYNDVEEERPERPSRREEKRAAKQEVAAAESYDEPVSPPKRTSFRTSSNKVVPIRTTPNGLEVCIIKPSNFGESQQVCEILLDGQPVIVNLEGMDIMEQQRIMDFVSGCIFSISGNMRQVSRYIFVFSPKSIDISGDYIKNMAEGEGFSIPTLHKEF